MKKLSCSFLIMLLPLMLLAQTQTIKGTVIDKDTRQPLVGATVVVEDTQPVMGGITDENGQFRLQGVPVGRHSIRCSYLGYEKFTTDNLIVNSVKEVVLHIELVEAIATTEEVVILAQETPNQAINRMSVVSTRSFSVEETERYAGSVNDPGRMAVGFAGVQSIKDNSSELIIRGNSAAGLLWRLEGIDIPNPNHFARAGSSGGGITVFSAQLLDNSDFSTGAFAAEYGNALSGVFDMHFRKGNREQREYRFKAGLLGLDFAAEGPFKKGRSSYLLNYRYSTLGILNDLGFRLVGERIDNNFQDLSFNLYFPSKDNNTVLTIFGIGGLSEELWEPVAEVSSWQIPSTDYETTEFISNMGATGLTLTHLLDEKSYLKAVVAATANFISIRDDTLNTRLEPALINEEAYKESRISGSFFYNRKFNSRFTLKTGFFASQLFFDFERQAYDFSEGVLNRLTDGSGNAFLLQPYLQGSIRPTEKLTLNLGLHSIWLGLNNRFSLEPRAALKLQLNEQQALSLAYGLHGQILPLGTYFTEVKAADGSSSMPNRDLKIMKSHHLVLGYNRLIGQGLRLNVEAYYQRLLHVPVSTRPGSTFWILNQRDGYATEALSSQGKGTNYGLDLTFERFFAKGLFFLLSASLYESTYELPDGRVFDTRYNGNYALNGMLGKEVSFKKGGTLQLGSRLIYGGGLRYTPGDPLLSRLEREHVPLEDLAYTGQVGDYFRIDLRLSYRKNLPGFAYILSLDVQNVTNRQNIRDEIYNPAIHGLEFRTQSGLIPVISFQLDF
ncbi:MAG: TonB-dependent receptor [Bacteroidetes bacterium]|nr:MAG: TonB-dependent receptor [Bacteroidota bacterium]